MNISLLGFIVGFIGGNLMALSLTPDIRVTLLDVGVVMVLLYGAYKKRNRFIPKLWLPIVAFAFVSLISGGDLAYIIRWLLYAALYWVAADTIFSLEAWQRVLVISGVGIAMLGFVQYALYPDLRNLYYLGWDPHYQRLFSTLLDPNFTGIILALTSLLLLTRRNLFWFTLTFIALVLTYSRSSLLAFVIGLVVLGFITKRNMLIAMVLSGLVLMIAVLPKTGEGRNLLRTVSSFARLDSAQYATSRIAQKPLFGHGFRPHTGIDTSLLFVAESTGFVGLLVYGWLLIVLWRHKEMRIYLAALLVHSLFVHSLFYPWVMAWVWIMAGVMERMSPVVPSSSRSQQGRGR